MREVTRHTLNTWLNMCQHPEKYCDQCGSVKKFCACQTQQHTHTPPCAIWEKHFGDAPAVALQQTAGFFEELNQVCTLENFVRDYCEGKDDDSCLNSPCRFASAGGCTHPQHPKNH